MKKLLVLFFVLILSNSLHAQFVADVILFTENGERFTAILNGIRQNDQPETNVKITKLNAEFYKLKVIFENSALGEKSFNLGLQQGMENTYVIKKNNKGEYVLRFMTAVPVAQAPSRPASQPVIVYHDNPVAAPVTTTSQTVTTTTSTSQGSSQLNPDGVNINVGVNIDGMGGGINMNVSGMDGSTASQTTVTHSTTTTTTTNGAMPVPVNATPVVYLPGYNGPVGCPVPMGPQDFEALKASIGSKSFEQTKYTMATQVLGDRCMFVSQVKQVMLMFSFEETRLDFARFAYDHTYDIGNYFMVNDAFTFESSIEELNTYIQSRR